MLTKGIRGAITVDSNTQEAIRNATLELIDTLMSENNLEISQISHVIFTLTQDLTMAFPAKFVRQERNWTETAMMCFNEAKIENALEKCLRVLIVVNCNDDFTPKFVYLKGASELRK